MSFSPIHHADEGEPRTGDDRPGGDIAVESVDEVHCVDECDADDGEYDDMRDPLCREQGDAGAEYQRHDDLSDQAAHRLQGVEVVAHADRRIAPGQRQEPDGQHDAAQTEGTVLRDVPDDGQDGRHGDSAADCYPTAAHGHLSVG